MAPGDLLYTREHEWVRIEEDIATVGITDYAQEQLGEITFVELPQLDMTVENHGEMGVVESSKAASDIYAPIAGKVSEVNDQLEDQPELINQDCYNVGWIYKLQIEDGTKPAGLLAANEYEEYLKGL